MKIIKITIKMSEMRKKLPQEMLCGEKREEMLMEKGPETPRQFYI